LDVVKGGTAAANNLNASGNWVWRVEIDTSNPIPSGSSPLDAELGFTATGAALVDANSLSSGAGVNFDTVVPGTPIWGWENPGTGTNGFPEGLQSNCAGGGCTEDTPGDDPNTIFAALGSQVYGAPTSNIPFIEIIAAEPDVDIPASLTTTIAVSGVYDVGSNKGRIAEWNGAPPPDSINHDTYTGSFTRTVVGGNANMDSLVDDSDLSIVLANFNDPGTWAEGDFNNDNLVDDSDLSIVLANFNDPGGSGLSSGGGGGSGAIPEPATVTLLGLAGLALAGLARRRR
jgi:hypothetical protein